MNPPALMNQLISIHVAKAGGSSLLKIFQTRFGDRMLADYSENPADPRSPRILNPARYMIRQTEIPAGIECVHGHFHPGKYAIPQNAILSTILRHPVDNLISTYFFWKTLSAGHDALHDYFLAQNLPYWKRLGYLFFAIFFLKRISAASIWPVST